MNPNSIPPEGTPLNPHALPTKPLYAAVNKGKDNFKRNNAFTKKVYFFQREDGSVFHTDAKDAWAILKGRKQRVGFWPERMKLIGVSDGSTFSKAVEEAHEMFKTQGLEASQARLRQGEAEELEVAKKTIEMPPNPDTVDLQGNPFNLDAVR